MQLHDGLSPMFNVGDPATLKQIEHSHIRYWMEEKGSQKEAAPILGLNPGSLSRKIAKENIKYIKNAQRKPDLDPPSTRQHDEAERGQFLTSTTFGNGVSS